MKIKRFTFLLILFLLLFPLLISQINISDRILKENKETNYYPTLSNNNVGFEWEQSWGGAGHDLAYQIVLDSSNNIYVAGNYNMTGLGGDILLMKYSSSGNLEWTRTWQEDYSYCYGIALDSLNNIYLAGMKQSILTLPRIVLLKYTSAGVLDWSQEIFIGTQCLASGIVIDSSNNIYLSGWTYSAANTDVLLVKCDSSGIPQWNRTWNYGPAESCIDIALDSSNNLYLSAIVGLPGNPDIGLLKFNSSGDLQWYRIRGGAGWDLCKGVSLDSSENIYLAGTMEIAGNNQMCLVKFDPNGQYQWNETWGGAGIEMAWELDIDSSDNIYLIGNRNIDELFVNFNFGEIVILKYDSSGQYQWNHTRVEVQREGGYAIELDSTEENIYIAGMIETLALNDTLLVKYSLNGANGDGKEEIPSYDIFLILIFTSFTLAYFIKKIQKKKK
ncbi:MAG: hypothetical protein ACFE8L_11895 [Candidatus Hodarchaeota archaeon]